MPECLGYPVWRRDCNTCRCHDKKASCTEKACGKICSDICPANYDPVCGTDGRTYSNLCQLQAVACHNNMTRLLHSGPCDLCALEPDSGSCTKYVSMWYYNKNTRQCQTFIYYGCLGNANRFRTEEECRRTCIGKKEL